MILEIPTFDTASLPSWQNWSKIMDANVIIGHCHRIWYPGSCINYDPFNLQAVGLKAIFFLFMMVWTLWVHGLCATTWVICVLTLKAVRLSLLHCIGIIYITCIIMFIASLMCYFWHSLAYLSLFTAYNKTFAHRPWIISLSTGLGLCCFVVAYLESIFIHRMLLEFTLGLMVGVGGRV